MLKLSLKKLSFILLLGVPLRLWADPIEVLVKLSPAGSFVMKSKEVEGQVTEKNGKLTAASLKIPVKSLSTGLALRDKHTLERLESTKFPYIELKTGVGEKGLGTGTISIRGVEKPIKGTYTLKDKQVIAKFNLEVKDFGIEKIRYLGVGVKDTVEVTATLPVVPAK